jgi:D-3-phosphoglycerate dehydrogenase
MMKVLLATDKPFAPVAVVQMQNIIQDNGMEFLKLEKYTDKQQLLDAVKDVNAIIIRSDIIDKEVLEAAKELKIVVRAGAGYDNVDLKTAAEHDVVVENTPGQNSNAVAELAIGLMIFMSRKKYDGTSGTELKGKRLGLHAFGYVSKNVARIARSFDMDIYAFDPYISSKEIESFGAKPVNSVEELYKCSDYISLHIPANAQTKKSINYELLKKLPMGATIINTARKEVIDEEGLLELMEERDDIKFFSDIIPDRIVDFNEKYAARVFFSPKKMGAQTSEANINAGLAAARQIVKFFKEGDTTFKVN